jgi:cytochrome c biogenesis protein CcmG/thiol:disulfide interchange protein DsbE
MTVSMPRKFRAVALVLLASAGTPVLSLEVGDLAPVLSLQGRETPVAVPVTGKLTYVDFWASWCGPCRKSFPWMNQMHRKYAAEGFEIVAVNLDQDGADAAAFLEQIPAEFGIAFDATGSSASLYGVKGMPTSLLVGPDGKVLEVHTGFNEKDVEVLEQMIRSHLEAKP